MTNLTLPVPSATRSPHVPHAGPAPWLWAAAAGLAATGGFHLMVASSLVGQPIVQVLFLLTALAGFGAASFLSCLQATRQRPPRWMAVLVVSGTLGVVLLDLFGATTDLMADDTAGVSAGVGRPAAGAAMVAAVLTVFAATTLAEGAWRRRSRQLLVGVLVAGWLLWLMGLLS
jgi:hypothetical protein